MTPCTQEQNITLIKSSLERMENGFSRIVDLLQTVAAQSARLDALERESNKCDSYQNTLFDRVRKTELTLAELDPERIENLRDTMEETNRRIDRINARLEKFNEFTKRLCAKPALTVYAIVLGMLGLNTLSMLLHHTEWVKQLWIQWRG